MNDGDMNVGTDYWGENYPVKMSREQWLRKWPKYWAIKDKGRGWEVCPCCRKEMMGTRLTRHHPLGWVHYDCALEEWIKTRDFDRHLGQFTQEVADRSEREWSGGNEALAIVKFQGRQGKSADVLYDGSRTIQQGRYGVKTS